MIFITGDTHRDFHKVIALCNQQNTSTDDILIILGDAGINCYGSEKDAYLKMELSKLPITLFCIHGNHEQRPETIPSYIQKKWNGGTVFVEPQFPNLLFAKDGEIFDFDGRRFITIGGAYSVDKYYRIENGWGWWDDEQPSEVIKGYVENRLYEIDWKIDYVLSHTCPLKYEPVEVFLKFIDQSSVDKSTEEWLDEIESKLDYGKWYCGHYHTDKTIDKMRFMFDDFVRLSWQGDK